MHEAQVDGEVQAGARALDVLGEQLASALGLRLRGDDARPDRLGHAGEHAALVLLGEGDAADAGVALDEDQAAEMRVDVRVDGVDEALGDGRRGEALEERGAGGFGVGGHASLFLRDLRAEETRWRAASGEQSRRSAMAS